MCLTELTGTGSHRLGNAWRIFCLVPNSLFPVKLIILSIWPLMGARYLPSTSHYLFVKFGLSRLSSRNKKYVCLLVSSKIMSTLYLTGPDIWPHTEMGARPTMRLTRDSVT